jgi:ADP-heptose:LPS heptosyltransferase
MTRAPIGDGFRRASRLLAIRLDAMGDVVMTTPALRAMRYGAPAARISLLTSSSGATVAPLIPFIDEVIVYDAPWVKRPAAPAPADAATDAATDRSMLERLREERFDAAVVFTVHSQSPLPAALLCRLAGIPRVLAHCRENPYELISDWIPEPEPDAPSRHEVRRQLDLVGAAGFVADEEHLTLHVPDHRAREARGLAGELGLRPGDSWVVLHPGGSAASRRYPVELWVLVAGSLARDYGVRLVLTGTAAERELTGEIAEATGLDAVDLAGRLDVPGLCALLALAPVLVAGNSGPVHLAAAVGTPVVDVYAMTNLQHTPWGVPSRVITNPVPCAGCRRSVCPLGHHRCMTGIDPQRVVSATVDLLGVPGAIEQVLRHT